MKIFNKNSKRYLAGETFAANDPRLRFNEMVTEVYFTLEDDQSVPAGLPNNGVYVKTSSGNEYWAQYCVITFRCDHVLVSSDKMLEMVRCCLHLERGASERERVFPAPASAVESPFAQPSRNCGV